MTLSYCFQSSTVFGQFLRAPPGFSCFVSKIRALDIAWTSHIPIFPLSENWSCTEVCNQTMASSSSSDKGSTRVEGQFNNSSIEFYSSNTLKKTSRSREICHGCRESCKDLGGVSFKSCGRCRTALYCSTACQLAHWSEHKGVCKKRVEGRVDAQKVAPGPKFIHDFDKWARVSVQNLDHVNILLLLEAAEISSRSGTRVTAEDLSHNSCMVTNAHYMPGKRLPFQIRGDYEILSLEALQKPNMYGMPMFQDAVKEFRKAEDREKSASSGLLVLKMIVAPLPNLGDMTKVLMSSVSPETFDEARYRKRRFGNTPAGVVGDINNGFCYN